MNTARYTEEKKNALQLFVVAATLYTVCIVAFSTWIFLQQRHNLYGYLDKSLIQAAYATEQIIGAHTLSETASQAGMTPKEISQLQKQLCQFATDNHFATLGAVAYNQGQIDTLIAATHPSTASEVLLTDHLVTILHEQIESKANNPWSGFTRKTPKKTIRAVVLNRKTAANSGYALIATREIEDIRQMLRIQAAEDAAKGLFLFIMAYPMILLYNRAQQMTGKQLEALNVKLRNDVEQQRHRENQLEEAVRDLERLNAVTVGRENRIIALKQEVNTLLQELERPVRYNIISKRDSIG